MKKRVLTRRNFLTSASALAGAPWLVNSFAAQPVAGAVGLLPVPKGLQAAVFACDVTPPVGSPLEECDPPVATSKDTPLQAKGVVLSDGKTRYVLCAFDYCELRTGGHDLVRRKIADAAQTNELQVEVHCVHQHNAPIYDTWSEFLIDWQPSPPHIVDFPFVEQMSDRVATAVREALDRPQHLTHVGYGKAKVKKVASNRRVHMPDGTIGVRYSSCTNPVLIAAPEGLIDPWLRTITLFDHDHPIARLHYYATHPQSYYGKGHMNPDFPGFARNQLEKEEGVPQIYFTGCAGNVAAGKYNRGTPEDRRKLTERMYTGMKEAIAATRRAPISEIGWEKSEVRFAARTEPEFSEEHFRKVLADPDRPYHKRTRASFCLSWYERLKVQPAISLSAYRLGPVRILHLPGESFVQYQLYAQSVRPDEFLAVAAYGELGTGYICMDKSPQEGGYEPTNSFVGPPSEERYKAAIAEVLRA